MALYVIGKGATMHVILLIKLIHWFMVGSLVKGTDLFVNFVFWLIG